MALQFLSSALRIMNVDEYSSPHVNEETDNSDVDEPVETESITTASSVEIASPLA